MWMMIFLLLPLLGIAYIAWHVWCLLPCAWWWKLLAIALLTGSFLTMMFGMRGLYDSMPLSVSHCAVGLSVLYYDVWHARVIR